MIGIINYGLGNVEAIVNVYKKLNINATIVRQPSDLKAFKKLILPGVGSFDRAMKLFTQSGMRKLVEKFVLENHIPILGICVGMQILSNKSEEGSLHGLGWINGEIKRFTFKNPSIRIPHMGWNDVKPLTINGLFKGLENNALFYFLHSYYFHCRRSKDVIGVTDYYGEFACAVNSDNIFGVQFHPEKSHQWGIKLLKNFAEL